MAPTLDDLFASPDHYLHSFDSDAAVFVPMDRAAYHRSIFLDGRISPANTTSVRFPVRALLEATPPPVQSTGWIFHVAHCGSTLLARALDQLSKNLVLREPAALRQLAFVADPKRLALVMAMVSKRYRADLPTIVKANVPVNFLLSDLTAFDPLAPTIFLYLGLSDFVLATLRNERHRLWLRRLTSQLSAYLGDCSEMSDAERTAALWLAQMHAFSTVITNLANARALDGEAFFAAPSHFLGLAAAHLGVPMAREEIEARVAGPLFANYSKIPEMPFTNETRLAMRAALEPALAPELEQAQRWVEDRGGEQKAVEIVTSASLEADRF
jgi:hypothetical protein